MSAKTSIRVGEGEDTAFLEALAQAVAQATQPVSEEPPAVVVPPPQVPVAQPKAPVVPPVVVVPDPFFKIVIDTDSGTFRKGFFWLGASIVFVGGAIALSLTRRKKG